MRSSARVTYPWKVRIGDHSWIGDRAEIYSLVEIEIGEHVCISQDTYLASAGHDHTDIHFSYITGKITIEDEVWVGSGAFIMPGITIGKGAIVSARAVVTKNVAEASIVAGVPAKEIGKRQALKPTHDGAKAG